MSVDAVILDLGGVFVEYRGVEPAFPDYNARERSFALVHEIVESL
jgi:hypothetical protein